MLKLKKQIQYNAMHTGGLSMNIRVELSKNLKEKPKDESKLGFGQIFTDHMFLMNYEEGKGWFDARIVPYGPISLDPAATCLHYGQLVFEGLKAYRTKNDGIVMFRAQENFKRINKSDERLCIPDINVEDMVKALKKLVEIEKDWVPYSEGTSLYIRPYVMATEAFLGVKPASKYLFAIILSPSGPYYKGGLAPVKIYVEQNYVRAVKGGTGFTKCAGNYAASLISQVEAHKEGYAQVLWLDGVKKENVEEVGSMNVFFVIDGIVVTPAINGSILPGITRMSIIDILKDWKIPVEEREISIEEVANAYKQGKLNEAFGTGTAAVISPIGTLKFGDLAMNINNNEIGKLSQRLYDELTGIQTCKIADKFGWVCKIG